MREVKAAGRVQVQEAAEGKKEKRADRVTVSMAKPEASLLRWV